MLSVLDRKWREHLYEMDYLKEGIGLRAMAQRDPLVEYQREGFDMFAAMLDSLKEESVGFLFNLQVQVVQPGAEGSTDGSAALVGGAANGAASEGAANGSTAAAGANGGTNGGGGANGVAGSRKRARVRPVAALPTQEVAAARSSQSAQAAESAPAALRAKGLTAPAAATALTYSGPGDAGAPQAGGKPARAGAATASKEPGRNAPCPCGSGKKYKMCHGRPGGAG